MADKMDWKSIEKPDFYWLEAGRVAVFVIFKEFWDIKSTLIFLICVFIEEIITLDLEVSLSPNLLQGGQQMSEFQFLRVICLTSDPNSINAMHKIWFIFNSLKGTILKEIEARTPCVECKVSGTEEKCYFGFDVGQNVTD